MVFLTAFLFVFLQQPHIQQNKTPQREQVVDPTPRKPVSEGPFGFEPGMKKKDVIAKLGVKSVIKTEGDIVFFNTAPKPHPDFEEYMAIFSPTSGLVKLFAIGKTIDTNTSGDQVKQKFADIKSALNLRYGKSNDIDHLKAGSIWKEDGEWMMSVLKKDRNLESYWFDKPLSYLPNGIKAIKLEATALKLDSGFVSLTYEFSGFDAYADSAKAKQNSAF